MGAQEAKQTSDNSPMRGKLSIIAGRSNQRLAAKAAVAAGVELVGCDTRRFSDGELSVEIGANVRGGDVFVVQSISSPGNDHIIELLLIIDALKRASAERITAVIPYYGYARQDRKTKPRVPIAAKLLANLIVAAGANRVLTMDLHADQIMGFFDIPVDNLYARPVLLPYLAEQYGSNGPKSNGLPLCVVSPDAGGVTRARAFAKRLDVGLAIIDKRRNQPNEVAEMNVVGDVRGKVAIVVDDMIDTGGTLIKAADALFENGAEKVVCCCTHAVLSGAAKDAIPKSRISEVIVADTIYHPDVDSCASWLTMLSISHLLGDAIRRIHRDDSLSILFGED